MSLKKQQIMASGLAKIALKIKTTIALHLPKEQHLRTQNCSLKEQKRAQLVPPE